MSPRNILRLLAFASLTSLGAACAPLSHAALPVSTHIPSPTTPPDDRRASATPATPTSATAPASVHPPVVERAPPPPGPAPSTSTAVTPAPDDEDPIDFEEHGDLPRAHREVLRIVAKCFLRTLDRGERSTGALFVELALDPTGKVLGVTMAEGFSRGVTTCAEPRLREVQFAQGDGRLGLLRIPIQQLSPEEVDPSR